MSPTSIKMLNLWVLTAIPNDLDCKLCSRDYIFIHFHNNMQVCVI